MMTQPSYSHHTGELELYKHMSMYGSCTVTVTLLTIYTQQYTHSYNDFYENFLVLKPK